MVLFVHNRYRTTGGEERTVEDLLWLVREQLGEPAQLLARDPADGSAGRVRAAVGLLGGGLGAAEVARAVRAGDARVVHAHNLLPSLGWRALAAAKAAGARVVLHLHQYRLVCAVGVCFTRGAECTRCHARNTLPGVLRNCRASMPEALTYGAALALWQQRLIAQADVVLVPSVFARERLRALGAPLPWERVRVLAPPLRSLTLERERPARERAEQSGEPYALVVSRLAAEKGVDVAIDACGAAGMPLVIAGDGPERGALWQRAAARAGGPKVDFLGHVGDERLQELRAGAAVAIVPSRSGESFGLAAAEALAAGVPVVGSRVGALGELVEADALVGPGDPAALARVIARFAGDREAGERGREHVRAVCAPRTVARALAAAYDAST